MITYILIGLLLALSAAARAVADGIAHHNSFKERGLWWDYEQGCQWKYKTIGIDPEGYIINQYPLTAKFWGSTTFLVFLTDAWHCFCMVRDTAWQLALVLLLPLPWYGLLGAFMVGKAAYSTIFQLLYTHFNKQSL